MSRQRLGKCLAREVKPGPDVSTALSFIPARAFGALITIVGDAGAANPQRVGYYSLDGADASSASSFPIGDGDVIELTCREDIANFKIIAEPGLTNSVRVMYFGDNLNSNSN